MPSTSRPGPASPRLPALVRGATLGALLWLAADRLGLPDLAGLPAAPLIVAALLGGAWIGTTSRARLLDVAATALATVLVLVAMTPIMRLAVRPLITAETVGPGGADAVIVLSASVSRDGMLSPAGTERLLHGIALLRTGVAPVLVTSRVRVGDGRPPVDSDADQARLMALLPAEPRWLVVDSVASTRDEAVRAAALAAVEGWRRVVVVTSPLHTRRACAAFRATGLTVTCAAAPSRGAAIHSMATPHDRLAVFGPWLYETVAWWWYGRRGWR